jgi:hypothetical protein
MSLRSTGCLPRRFDTFYTCDRNGKEAEILCRECILESEPLAMFEDESLAEWRERNDVERGALPFHIYERVPEETVCENSIHAFMPGEGCMGDLKDEDEEERGKRKNIEGP